VDTDLFGSAITFIETAYSSIGNNKMFVDRAEKDDDNNKKFRKNHDSCDNADETALHPEDGSLSHPKESGGNKMVDLLNIDPRAVDAMLARELHQLSFQAREAVNEVRRHAGNVLQPLFLVQPILLLSSCTYLVPLDLFLSPLPGDSWRPHACSS
jgi:hypothetical protein